MQESNDENNDVKGLKLDAELNFIKRNENLLSRTSTRVNDSSVNIASTSLTGALSVDGLTALFNKLDYTKEGALGKDQCEEAMHLLFDRQVYVAFITLCYNILLEHNIYNTIINLIADESGG